MSNARQKRSRDESSRRPRGETPPRTFEPRVLCIRGNFATAVNSASIKRLLGRDKKRSASLPMRDELFTGLSKSRENRGWGTSVSGSHVRHRYPTEVKVQRSHRRRFIIHESLTSSRYARSSRRSVQGISPEVRCGTSANDVTFAALVGSVRSQGRPTFFSRLRSALRATAP